MHASAMKALPPNNADWRMRLAPLRTWAALSLVGLITTLVRNGLYSVPFTPIGAGLMPLLVLTMIGALYAVVVFGWLALRWLYVR